MRGFSRDQAHLRGERAGGQPATEKRNEAWFTEPSQKAPAFKHGDEWRVLISHVMRNEITIFQANRKKHERERRTNMRKLWVKAWMTLDGVFDADTMDPGGLLPM